MRPQARARLFVGAWETPGGPCWTATKNQPHREATNSARQCALWAEEKLPNNSVRKRQRHACSQDDLQRGSNSPRSGCIVLPTICLHKAWIAVPLFRGFMREVARCRGIQEERRYIAIRRPQIREQLWQSCSPAALPFLYLQAVFAIVAGFWTLCPALCFPFTGVSSGMWLPKCRTLGPIWGLLGLHRTACTI